MSNSNDNLTTEQKNIVNYVGSRLVVIAFAGTGKTYTLTAYARKNFSQRILYVAYNSAIKNEAVNKFPKNVICRTIHQMAYSKFGKDYKHKLKPFTLHDIHSVIKKSNNERPNWKKLKLVLETLTNYINDTSSEISLVHTPSLEKINKGNSSITLNELVELAQTMWRSMIDQMTDTPITHDTYLKLYQLSNPVLSNEFDIILFDEAQDANKVISEIILKQDCKIILVGDEHQQIYRFRGAMNALRHPLIMNEKKMYLTHSFRFGQKVALAANVLLELKGEVTPVIGQHYNDSVLIALPKLTYPRTIISRTNIGSISAAISQTALNKKIFWVGGIHSYLTDSIMDVYYLYTDKHHLIKNKKLNQQASSFEALKELNADISDPELARAINLTEEHNENIPTLLEKIKKSSVQTEDNADVIITTAHKSKGLEWDNVQLNDDFIDIFNPDLEQDVKNDEINLLYVAATRAKKMLGINPQLQKAINFISNKRIKERT